MSSADILDCYKEHSSGKRVATEVITIEEIRKAYPQHHVQRVSQHTDFVGYAKANPEHVNMSLVTTDDAFISTRTYKPPKSKLSKEAGELVNDYEFGLFRYIFESKEYLLYKITYHINNLLQTKWVVLTPLEGAVLDEEKNCSATDSMIMQVAHWTFTLGKEIYVFDHGRWSKDASLFEEVSKSSWSDVVLPPKMKESIINDVFSFYNNRATYAALHVPFKRGLLLHGTPGNGKTITIKALMRELSMRKEGSIPSLVVKSFENSQSGQMAISAVFNMARTCAPCMLIFEDLDSLVTAKLRSYFLNELDGIAGNDGLLIVGSTNHVASLDPAISRRPSRFDRKYAFRLPSHSARRQYAEYWRSNVKAANLLDFGDEMVEYIATITEGGFSFAYLKELLVGSLLVYASGRADEVLLELAEQTAAAQEGMEETGEALQKLKEEADIGIPESLASNQFAQILRTQSMLLRNEMGNAEVKT